MKPALNIAAIGAALLAFGAGAAHAQSGGGGEITWRGNVDDVARITISGSDVQTSRVSGRDTTGVSVQKRGTFSNGQRFTLQKVRGRGEVTLVQSASARNNYTTIVEIRDYDGGDAPYEFRLRFGSGNDNYGYDRNSRDDRYNRNDRYNRYDRDDRRGGNGRFGTGNNNGRFGNRRGGNNGDGPDIDNARDARAYQRGFELARQDAGRRLSYDYSRWRSEYTGGTEAEFRRGYRDGYGPTTTGRRPVR